MAVDIKKALAVPSRSKEKTQKQNEEATVSP